MTAQDENFAKQLTGYLDQGTAGLKAGTVYRLQQARAAAMARLAAEPGRVSESRLAHAFAGGAGSGAGSTGGRGLLTSARFWFASSSISGTESSASTSPGSTSLPSPCLGPRTFWPMSKRTLPT